MVIRTDKFPTIMSDTTSKIQEFQKTSNFINA
jgi:hypothetical protein